ncbi:MAG: HTTM domain-containing protein [Planctomycetota bacterium]
MAIAWLTAIVGSFVVLPSVLLDAFDGESLAWLNQKIAAHRELATTRGLPTRDRDWYADSAYRYAWRVVAFATVAASVALLAVFWRKTLAAIRGFLFQPDSAINLGFARLVVFSMVLFELGKQPINEVAAMPADLYQWPALAPWLLGWFPIDAAFTTWAVPVAMIAALGAALGVAFRLTGPLAAIMSVYLLGIPTLAGKVDHHHHVVLLAALLACSPADHAFSLKAWLGRAPTPPRSVAYGLPLRFSAVVIATCYFFPGFWKAAAGPGWVFGDAMKNTALNVWFDKEHFTPIMRVDRLHALSALGALGTIAFEVGFLLALPFRRCRWAMIVAGQSFHTMVMLTLGITFYSLQLVYVVFVDWDRLWRTFFPSLNKPSVEEAAPRSRPRFFLMTVFLVIWLGMLATGFTRTVSGWPVACYPTFDATPETQKTWPRFWATWQDGARVELDDDAIRDYFGRARYVMVLRPLVVDANSETDVRDRLAGLLPAWEASGELSATSPPATVEVEAATFELEGPRRPTEPVHVVSRGVFDWESLQAAASADSEG